MEEADQLCDRIGIIDRGKIQVIDSPENMKNAMGNEVISLIFDGENRDSFLSEIQKIESVKKINKDEKNFNTAFVRCKHAKCCARKSVTSFKLC